MAFLRTSLMADSQPFIEESGLLLRPPAMSDYAAWAELRNRSREHLVPWEPQWAADELTRSAFRRRLRHYNREMKEGLGYAFLIFRSDSAELVGGVTLSNVRRGVTQAASLGYWMGQPFSRRGYMTRAVAGALHFGFDDLQLHRIEAACLPQNEGSIRVLRNNSFVQEGLARSYLKIDGTWRDHLLFAVLAGDPWRRRR